MSDCYFGVSSVNHSDFDSEELLLKISCNILDTVRYIQMRQMTSKGI